MRYQASLNALTVSGLISPDGTSEGAVANQHAGLVAEFGRQPFGDIDRTVLATGAADGDGQIIAVVADVAG